MKIGAFKNQRSMRMMNRISCTWISWRDKAYLKEVTPAGHEDRGLEHIEGHSYFAQVVPDGHGDWTLVIDAYLEEVTPAGHEDGGLEEPKEDADDEENH